MNNRANVSGGNMFASGYAQNIIQFNKESPVKPGRVNYN